MVEESKSEQETAAEMYSGGDSEEQSPVERLIKSDDWSNELHPAGRGGSSPSQND